MSAWTKTDTHDLVKLLLTLSAMVLVLRASVAYFTPFTIDVGTAWMISALGLLCLRLALKHFRLYLSHTKHVRRCRAKA
jgi:hypothetical protein